MSGTIYHHLKFKPLLLFHLSKGKEKYDWFSLKVDTNPNVSLSVMKKFKPATKIVAGSLTIAHTPPPKHDIELTLLSPPEIARMSPVIDQLACHTTSLKDGRIYKYM